MVIRWCLVVAAVCTALCCHATCGTDVPGRSAGFLRHELGTVRSYRVQWRMLPAPTSTPLSYNDFARWQPPLQAKNSGIQCHLLLRLIGALPRDAPAPVPTPTVSGAAADQVYQARLVRCHGIQSRFRGEWSTADVPDADGADTADGMTAAVKSDFFPVFDAATGSVKGVLFPDAGAADTGADAADHDADTDAELQRKSETAFKRGVAAMMAFVHAPEHAAAADRLPVWTGASAEDDWFPVEVDGIEEASVEVQAAGLDDQSHLASVHQYIVDTVRCRAAKDGGGALLACCPSAAHRGALLLLVSCACRRTAMMAAKGQRRTTCAVWRAGTASCGAR